MLSGKWAFDESVAGGLAIEMERSIPGYWDMREAITRFVEVCASQHAFDASPTFVDVGCAVGEQFEELRIAMGARPFNYYGLDNSEAMIKWCEEHSTVGDPQIRRRFFKHDIASGISLEEIGIGDADIVFCILTLQFVPEKLRGEAMRKMRDALHSDGMLVIVEKIDVSPRWRRTGTIREMHVASKRNAGLTEDEILAKQKALDGVLIPWRQSWNEELFKNTGFQEPHVFWANTCFMGWMMFK